MACGRGVRCQCCQALLQLLLGRIDDVQLRKLWHDLCVLPTLLQWTDAVIHAALDEHRVRLLVLWCVQAGGGHAQSGVVGARVLPEVLCSAVGGVSEELQQRLGCCLWEDVLQVHLAMHAAHAAQRAALLPLVIL